MNLRAMIDIKIVFDVNVKHENQVNLQYKDEYYYNTCALFVPDINLIFICGNRVCKLNNDSIIFN